MRKVTAVHWVSILLIVLFVALAGSVQADEKVIKLRYSNFFPPSHKNSILSEQWGKEIEKELTDKFKVTLLCREYTDTSHSDL